MTTELEADGHASRIAELEAELAKWQIRASENGERVATQAETIQRLTDGLMAIHSAPVATVCALQSVAYDIVLNLMNAETAEFQIGRRAALSADKGEEKPLRYSRLNTPEHGKLVPAPDVALEALESIKQQAGSDHA